MIWIILAIAVILILPPSIPFLLFIGLLVLLAFLYIMKNRPKGVTGLRSYIDGIGGAFTMVGRLGIWAGWLSFGLLLVVLYQMFA